MGLSLKGIGKKIEGLGAQLNPFDNGKTYNTVANNQRPVANQGSLVSNNLGRVQNVVRNDVISPLGRDVVRPVLNFPQTLNHDVWQAANRDVLHPIYRAPQNFINDVANPIESAAIKTPVGRGLEDVGLGALRGFTGIAQGASGLYDLATKGTGTNRITKALNNTAVGTDQTVRDQNMNRGIYTGGQIAANVLPGLLTLGGSAAPAAVEGTEEVAKGGNVLTRLAELKNAANASTEAKIAAATQDLYDSSKTGRIAAGTIRSIAKPSVQLTNATYTALQAGAQSGKGQKVTPKEVGTNLAIGGLVFPAIGAVGNETIVQPALNGLRNANLVRPANLTNAEVAAVAKMREISGTGASMGEDATFNSARKALQKIGIKPSDTEKIDGLLGNFRTYYTRSQQRQLALNDAKKRLSVGNEIGAVGKDVNEYKYKLSTAEGGTQYYNDLTPKNSFQDINGDRHPFQSDAKITIRDWDGTGETKVIKVRGIGSQKNFNGLLKKYSERGEVANAIVDESPALVTKQVKPTVRVRENPSTSVSTVGKSVKATPEELAMGKALGMSEKDVIKAKEPLELAKVKAKSKTPLKIPQAEENAINPVAPIELPKVKNATEAIRAGESLAGDFSQRASLLASAQDKVLGKSLANRDKFITAIEHPEQASEIAKTFGGKSQAFTDLLAQHKAVTDLEHASQTGAGNPRGYIGGNSGYITHNVKFNTPEDQAAYDTLLTRTIKGRTALERTNPDLETLRANGLDIADDTAGNATRKWAARQSNIMRDAALEDRLRSIDPNLQVVQAPGENPRFVSSNKEFNKQLKGVQPFQNPGLLKPIDTLNTGLKQVGLFGGGFHDFKTTIRQVSTDLVSMRNPISRLVEGNKQLFSNEAHNSWNQARIDEGWGKLWADADVAKANIGADLHGGVVKDLTKGSVEKLNPYMERLFGNKLDYFKKQLVIDEAIKNGINPKNYDSNDAAQRKIIQEAGDGAKNWFGGLNQRTLAKSPAMQHILKYITLAPDFTEGKIRAVANVARKGEAGSLARRQVLGEAVGVAILAEAASKGLTGKFTNPASTIVNPQIKTNMKDKKGRPLTIGLPGSTIADVNRAVTDPSHFAQSHLAAAPSVVASAVSGKDYYGNPLVDPFKNPNPNFGQNLVASLKSRGTIPGVQLSKTLSGDQNASTAIINTLGGRVALDKTDPAYIQTQNYFKTRDDALKTLNPNEKALWQSIHPQTQDAGAYVSSSAPVEQKDIIYQKNPKLFEVDKKIALSQPTHDPIFDLPDQQRNDLFNIAQIKAAHGGTTGAGAVGTVDSNYIKTIEGSKWYGDFENTRSDYYNGLNLSSNPLNPAGTTRAPQSVQDILDQMGTKGVNTSVLLGENPEAEAWLSTHSDEINQQRVDKGLPTLPKFPMIPNDTIRQKEIAYNQLPSGTGARSAFLKANPDYQSFWQQKQDYYAAIDGSSTAQSYNSGYGGGSSGSSTGNPYKYAVSLDSGGSIAKPKISVKAPSIAKAKVKSRGKRSVTTKITKSKV